VTASDFTLRDARPGDEDTIAGFVRELAEYEKLPHEARATAADFHRALFTTPPRAHALVVEAGADPVGFALWFYNFSTFTGRPGLYLEDLYVVPAWRGRGIGRAVFRFLARRAIEENCGRMEWWVLDWNTPAIEFYRSMGAQPMDDWTVQRLSGEALAAIAG
jgi:GNAT superfamily N-acetyltransferase